MDKEGIPVKTVKQLLDVKGYDVWSIGPESSVLDAIKLMAGKGIGALLVMVVLGTLIGLIPAQRAVSIKPIDALREE